MSLKNTSTTIILTVLAFLPTTVYAAGLNVSPPKLEISEGGKAALVVSNPTKEEQVFSVTADEWGEKLNISPDEFVLSAGAKKTVSVGVVAEATGFSTSLSVVAAPTKAAGANVASGIKIPLKITTHSLYLNPVRQTPNPDNNLSRWLFGALALLLLPLAALAKRKLF